MASLTQRTWMSLSKFQETVKYREACHAAVHGVKKRNAWTAEQQQQQIPIFAYRYSKKERQGKKGKHIFLAVRTLRIYSFISFLMYHVAVLTIVIILYITCLCYAQLLQTCPTLCDPMDCSPPSSVHRIAQARILEWVAISFSRGSSPPRDQTWVSCIAGRFFTTEPPGKPTVLL